jgi:hypothetical protein
MAPVKPLVPQKLRCLPLLAFSLSVAVLGLLTGCGAGPAATSASGTLAIAGTVHGGQQPVIGATISLYTAGKTGNGSTARSMLTTTVKTDGSGFFSISGDYTCTNANDQVYVVASQGDSGSGTSNPALMMVDAVGNCSNLLGGNFYISMNEITTVAAAWALAPFATSASTVGASSTNATGLANAFLNAQLLASPQTGKVATLAANQTVETGKLLALADVIAPCINSDGTTGCAALFSAAMPSGGTAPTNTWQAALNIVKHPGQNVTAVFNCINGQAPFPTTLTSAPNDWTMSLAVTADGFYSPEALSIDASGNVWSVGENSSSGSTHPSGIVEAFSPQGIPLNSSGYGSGVLDESFGLTVDNNGNVWVTNWANISHGTTTGSLTEFQGANSASPGSIVLNGGSDFFYDNSLDYPTSIAADNGGFLFIANYANSTASVYNTSGAVIYGGLAYGSSAFPTYVTPDGSHGFWLANSGDNTVTHVNSSGNVVAHPGCCSQTYGLGVDASGNAWTGNYGTDSVSEVSSAGSVVISNDSAGGVVSPSAVAVDGAQNVWVANYRATRYNASISELAGNGNTLAAGSGISPNYVSAAAPGGYGLDAGLIIPYALMADASGNLWVANTGNNDLVMFFGLTTPTATPMLSLPKAP